jgi:peptidase E
MNLIVASNFPATPSAAIVAALRQNAEPPRIAWIPSHTDPSGEHFRSAEREFQTLGISGLELLDIDADADPVQIAYLHEYDVVFLTGDDAIRFRFNAARSGLAGRLRQYAASGRLIAGSGGGALLLTPNVSTYRLHRDRLDAVRADRGRFDALGVDAGDAALQDKLRAYSAHVDHDVLALAEGAAIIHRDGQISTEGRLVRYRNGKIIEP